MLFFIFYSAIVIPIRIPFEDDPHLFFVIFDTIMDFLFMVDILINFNTAFEDDEANIITNWKWICFNYIWTWFFLDFISCVPLTLIGKLTDVDYNKNIKYVKLTRLPRLYRLLRLMKLVKLWKLSWFIELSLSKVGLSIDTQEKIKMLAYLILLIHIYGCIWAIASNLESDDWMNWVKNENVEDKPTFMKYITAIYWAVYTV